MNHSYINLLCCLFILGLVSCADESKNSNAESDSPDVSASDSKRQGRDADFNVSFLLDLSDRINPNKYPNGTMEYYLRDVAYIQSVAEAFDSHLRKKRVSQMDDRIQVFFDPEPQNQNINNISNDLRFSISRENASLDLLAKIKQTYSSKPLEIYKLAIKDDHYVGSDTWKFFKTKIKDFCIEDGFRNILVILTDGYIYHKNTIIKEENRTSYLIPQTIREFQLTDINWNDKITEKGYGFIPANHNLQAIEILVLGINPYPNNPFEEDVLLKYWKDWMDTMEVGRYQIKTTGLPSDMDKIIKDFILN